MVALLGCGWQYKSSGPVGKRCRRWWLQGPLFSKESKLCLLNEILKSCPLSLLLFYFTWPVNIHSVNHLDFYQINFDFKDSTCWRWVFFTCFAFPFLTLPLHIPDSRMCPLWCRMYCSQCMLHGETIITSKEIVFWAQSGEKAIWSPVQCFLFYWNSTSSACYVTVLIQNLDILWKIIPLIAGLLILIRFTADVQVCLHGNDC